MFVILIAVTEPSTVVSTKTQWQHTWIYSHTLVTRDHWTVLAKLQRCTSVVLPQHGLQQPLCKRAPEVQTSTSPQIQTLPNPAPPKQTIINVHMSSGFNIKIRHYYFRGMLGSDLNQSSEDSRSSCHLHPVWVPGCYVHLCCDVGPICFEEIHVWSQSLCHTTNHDAEHSERTWAQRKTATNDIIYVIMAIRQCLSFYLPMDIWRDVPKKM